MNQLTVLLFTILGYAALCGASGCAIEVENPGKPNASIVPKRDEPDSANVPASDKAISPSPNSSPEVFAPCSYTIERNGVGSSGLNGATVRIIETAASSQTDMFVYIAEQSRYVNVRDVAFTPTALPAGNYSFVVTRPERENCSIVIQINTSDIEDKIELSVRLND